MKEKVILKSDKQKTHLWSLLKQLNYDEVHEISIKPYKKNRSLDQNALYWLWIGHMSKISEIPTPRFHHLLATQYLEPDIYELNGEVYTRIKSTTELSVSEFNEYLSHIEVFAAESGVILPDPELYKRAMGIKE